jgi:hypothetical protein
MPAAQLLPPRIGLARIPRLLLVPLHDLPPPLLNVLPLPPVQLLLRPAPHILLRRLDALLAVVPALLSSSVRRHTGRLASEWSLCAVDLDWG